MVEIIKKTWIFLFFISINFFVNNLCGVNNLLVIEDIYNKTYNDFNRINILIQLANYNRNRNINNMNIYSMKAYKLSEKLSNYYFSCISQKLISQSLTLKGDFYESINNYEKLLKVYSENQDFKNEAFIHTCIGNSYLALFKFDKALENFFEALKIYENATDENIVYLYSKLGMLYKFQKNYDEAINCFNIAHFYYIKYDYTNKYYNPYDDLGYIYYDTGEKELSLLYLYKAIFENIRKKNIKNLAKSCNNLSVIYTLTEDFEKALIMVYYSLNIYNSLNDYYGISQAINNLAYIYELKSSYKKSFYYNKLTLKIRYFIGNNNIISSSLMNLGRIQYKRGIIENSKQYYLKALDIADKIGQFRWITNIYDKLDKIYLKNQDYKEAYNINKKLISKKDSIFSLESANKIAELQIKYETEQNEKEIELLNRNLEIKQLQIDKEKYIHMLLISIALIFLIIGTIIYFHYQQKHKTNKALKNQIKIREQAEIDLMDSQAELENRIIERTKELRQVNKDLRKEIKQKEQISKQLIRNERLAGIGEISSGIAHEIRNPIAIIKTTAQYLDLKYKESSDELSELTDIFVKSAEKINDTIGCMLEFAKPKNPEFKKDSLARVINKICKIMRRKLLDHRIVLKQNIPDQLPDVVFDESQIESLFLNLFMNSFDAILDGGCIFINLAKANNKLYIRIADNGTGIKPGYVPNVFDPFFTTKKTGTGLGLSSVFEIMQAHSGKVKVFSRYKIGTIFTLIFPTNKWEQV